MEIAFPVSVQFDDSEIRSPKTPRDIAAPYQSQTTSAKPEFQVFSDNQFIVDYRNFKFKPLESLMAIKYDNYVGPTLESNWVIPGVLLVGAYPASQDDDETFQLISSILKQGVTKFVCLQQEYRPTGVTEAMWRSGQALRPYFEDVKLIVKNRSRFETFKGHHNIVSDDRLSFVHFPIRDCSITDDSGVLQLARNLVKAISEGEVIYLHCWGGHGRTGTVLCIMLHLMYGLTPQEAMHRCQTVHDLRVYPVDVGSPQTQQQRDQVTRVITKLMETSEYTRTVGIGAPVPVKGFASSIPCMPAVPPGMIANNQQPHQPHQPHQQQYQQHQQQSQVMNQNVSIEINHGDNDHSSLDSYAHVIKGRVSDMDCARTPEVTSKTSQTIQGKTKQNGSYLFGYKFFKSKRHGSNPNQPLGSNGPMHYGRSGHSRQKASAGLDVKTTTPITVTNPPSVPEAAGNGNLTSSNNNNNNNNNISSSNGVTARPPSSQQPSNKHQSHHRNQHVRSRAKENESNQQSRNNSIDLGQSGNSSESQGYNHHHHHGYHHHHHHSNNNHQEGNPNKKSTYAHHHSHINNQHAVQA